jgi:hypothetical protein
MISAGMFVHAQQTDRSHEAGVRGAAATIPDASTATDDRLESEAWWPTMSTAPLNAYAGSANCIRCHADESSGTTSTGMQRAAAGAKDEPLLRRLVADRAMNSSYAPLLYDLRNSNGVVEYSVASGGEKKTQPLDWVMGAGDLGQTFVYQMDDHWYQSRMSLYAHAPTLDVTTGLKIEPGEDLAEALGKALTPSEVRRCFSCHTVHATTSRGFEPLHAEAGVGCEGCHGPGAEHGKKMVVAAVRNGGADRSIFNPAALSPADSIDFCGACHRTFDDVTTAANAASDSSVVRFQPYRLEESRCWRTTQDARLTCVACHDPHEPLNRNDLTYDKHCLGCHTGDPGASHPAKVCPTGAKSRCVSCHMPKVQVASMHGEFTDHFIRVVKAGEALPR